MAGPARPASSAAAKRSGLRQPTRRTTSAVPERRGSTAVSSRPSVASAVPASSTRPSPDLPQSQPKRKEPNYEREINEDTSIHVVVRCRGRNDREIKENSGVTYAFDRVFSPAADQTTVFNESVLPVVNEMLAGYNCTIFAYGQTGTGKTYTMSGDMTDTLGILSDDAGIIPRTLYSLFNKLEDTESTVKCSFIELYNEELRDLLAYDDSTKLKIFENERKGHPATVVQGMEETYIDSASNGIRLLQTGSHKRQVAATKCNDLSSRSHTIFTITVLTKRTTDSGEEYISSGKLNLVDLAGSENIGRSGAENKRAAEAGLINKSLLTLGRVINALVDKSSHIPYRESKLTRLLQDSLGGRTKTCIIATVSPAKSNLEETISTLDYAFRAKNIRNKPQINSLILKNKMLRDIGMEIEKLKSDLIATRHRNGVYMAPDAYEQLTTESESRRIVNEEQRAKIESMEANLRHKVQELFTLTGNFNSLKQDNEQTQGKLDTTRMALDETERNLKNTSERLDEETIVRKAHQDTEAKLRDMGASLLSTLNGTVKDVRDLHAKIEVKDNLENTNLQSWESSTEKVDSTYKTVDEHLEAFKKANAATVNESWQKMNDFIRNELETAQQVTSQIEMYSSSFENVEADARAQASTAHTEMNEILEEIKVLREDVKTKVGEGLQGLSVAAGRISEEVISELNECRSQLHSSYSNLGKDFRSMFESMAKHMDEQKSEINRLRTELQQANRESVESSRKASSSLAQLIEEEQNTAQAERENLLSQVRALLEDSNQRQTIRLKNKVDCLRTDISSSGDSLEQATAKYDRQVDEWIFKEEQFAKDVVASKDGIKTKLQNDWEDYDKRNASITKTTESVHQETVRIVDAQMNDMGSQMEALDDFVTKARSYNSSFHDAQLGSLDTISLNVQDSRSAIQTQLEAFGGRMDGLQVEVDTTFGRLGKEGGKLQEQIRQPLQELSSHVHSHPMQKYSPTGNSPKKRKYVYPTTLPRTESHESLRKRHRTSKQFTALPFSEEEAQPVSATGPSSPASSPSKQFVFSDAAEEVDISPSSAAKPPSNAGLREVDLNVANPSTSEEAAGDEALSQPFELDETPGTASRDEGERRSLKRRRSSIDADSAETKHPSKMPSKKVASMMGGRENVPPSAIPGGGRYNRTRSAN
ncbi:hypothetical protein N7468_006215 [Penicillium chermesinum]|uniref:Kinesin motor domain-containing protein n=1 Tax=Penicillium chermesinum TaxID=63820 RepID=A0A9W9TKX7_9EURO|nr:uncharacterized protein N7468_006215 [Penicillium chermesinum]KAJ5224990.1 hypothetical protein N7468_006215 [Penicillium chermesinum]